MFMFRFDQHRFRGVILTNGKAKYRFFARLKSDFAVIVVVLFLIGITACFSE